MVLADLEEARGGHEQRLWRLVAYVGRYCHQPADVALAMPVVDLMELGDAVAALLAEEAKSSK